jgi:hypothetical protein
MPELELKKEEAAEEHCHGPTMLNPAEDKLPNVVAEVGMEEVLDSGTETLERVVRLTGMVDSPLSRMVRHYLVVVEASYVVAQLGSLAPDTGGTTVEGGEEEEEEEVGVRSYMDVDTDMDTGMGTGRAENVATEVEPADSYDSDPAGSPDSDTSRHMDLQQLAGIQVDQQECQEADKADMMKIVDAAAPGRCLRPRWAEAPAVPRHADIAVVEGSEAGLSVCSAATDRGRVCHRHRRRVAASKLRVWRKFRSSPVRPFPMSCYGRF